MTSAWRRDLVICGIVGAMLGAGAGPAPATPLGQPTAALSLSTVNFGVVNIGGGIWLMQTPPQMLSLTFDAPGAVTWTAVTSDPSIVVSPASGSAAGPITIAVRGNVSGLPMAGQLSGSVTIMTNGAANNPSVTVNLTILVGATSPPTGIIETPAEGQSNVTGSLPVTGWAIDDIGVRAVRLCRLAAAGEAPVVADPHCAGRAEIYIGDAMLVSGARPDVAAFSPLTPLNHQAGWGYMLLTNVLPAQGNGTFTLTAYAEDYDGHMLQLGTRTIACANASATAPFGAIDTPTQGGMVSGAAFVNFGWALTPQPKTIPTDGSTIQVFVDSIPQGTVTYNNPRADIQALFPGYANTDGAIGFRIIDTTALANGVHTIFWVVSDNAGAQAGIGSRYFSVGNSALPALTQAPPSAPSQPPAEWPKMSLAAAPNLALLPSSTVGVTAARGFNDSAGRVVPADADGVRHVRLKALARLVLELDPDHDGAVYRGYELVGTELRSLPVGATLDSATGRFAWAPGLAFGGTRQLLFVRSIGGRDESVRIDITIDASPAAK